MKKSHRTTFSHKILSGGLRKIAVAAFLSALSIVCGKYLAINAGPVMRFSFENLPILFAGVVLGPVWGALVGAVADLIGCVLVGYAINPVVTLGAILVGLGGGVAYRVAPRLPHAVRLSLGVLTGHLLGSVLVKTWGLSVFYDMPFYVLLLWRLLNYAIVGGVEFSLLYFLLKNKAVRRLCEVLR
ncbi:MAG: folate family ECF transporter S component [Clostridia bacterium]|nr:folate family ECF transporter S component [Clostridia bacterium]